MKKIATSTGMVVGIVGAGALLATTAGTALAWETPVWISGNGLETGSLTDIVVDGKGGAYFGFAQQDAPYFRATVAHKPAGGALEPAVSVSQAGSTVWYAAMAGDKKGNVVMAWIEQDGSPESVKVATKDKKSAAFGAPVLVEDGDFGDVLVELDRKGTTTVAWSAGTGIGSATRPKKGVFAAPVEVSTDGGIWPFIEADRKGNTLLIWHAGNGMGGFHVVRSARPAGGVFDAPAVVSTTADGFTPRVAFDKKGNATAIWEGAVGVLWGAAIADMPASTFGTFGSPSVVSATTASIDPRITFDGKGNALGVWARRQGGLDRIEASDRPAGGMFGVSITLSDITRSSFAPQVAVDTKGNAYVIWASYSGPNYRVEMARRPAGGSFGATEVLYDGNEQVVNTRIAVDKKGNLFAAWTRLDSFVTRIEGTWEAAN